VQPRENDTEQDSMNIFMPSVRHTLVAVIALLAPHVASADSLGCLIEPSRVADVGSPVLGVLQEVKVDRGDVVKKGQVLAVLRADIERAQLNVATSRAQAEAELQAAAKAYDFAQKKRDRTEDLFKKQFVSGQALDQAIAEAQVAEARLRQAREQTRHSKQEVSLASAQLEMRTIKSPIDGIVIDRYLDSGERVEDRPILKVATISPLRVEVVLPAALYGRVQPGVAATVKPDLANLPSVQGTVSLVDRVIDPASNTFRARLELPNADGALPAGLRCKAQFPASVTAGVALQAAPAPAKPTPTSAAPTAAVTRR
jgi:membrane fusion protein, heavy metal efflux system